MKFVMTAVLAMALLAPAAYAGDTTKYPPAKDPAKLPPREGGKKATLEVCQKKGCFKTIQSAVNASRGGDTIKVSNGTYKEGVQIKHKGRKGLKIIGNAKNPEKVVLDGESLKGIKAQNAFIVNGVDNVTINGFRAIHYKGNGFFVINVTGYLLTNLIAEKTGTYGVYAFNSKGGTMSNSEAFHVNDAGFYVGQTPKQARPRRTFVKNVTSHENVLGFSGTNMRYVTIQDSRFFNNGLGIVPNALDSEKFPPEEFNVIKNNDVFWNNFNYYLGAPFELRKTAVGDLAYPVGVGILLFGGRNNVVDGNRIFGNYLFGFGMLDQIVLDQKDAASLDNNTVSNNKFGLDGTDLNGRDIGYDGSGSGNCFEGNEGAQNNTPADNSEIVNCPFEGPNGVNNEARGELVAPAVDEDHEKYWIKRGEHAPQDGITPLEHYEG